MTTRPPARSQTDIAAVFVRCVLASELDAAAVERLRNLTSTLGDIGTRPLDAMLKQARQQAAAARKEAVRAQRIEKLAMSRPVFDRPISDTEWLPVSDCINEVLGTTTDNVPPVRNIE